jgi:CRP-like cAMP-binding protein
VSDELGRFELLARLGEKERRDLAEQLEWLSFEAGATVFREGEPADGLMLLFDGEVRLTSSRADGEGTWGPGASFGAISLVVAGERHACVEARTPCRILRLDREGFQRLASASPRAACQLMEGIVRESADLVRGVLEDLPD